MINGSRTIFDWIFVPSLITFAVTILRLIGELQNWSPLLFNRAAGGGLALVGIWWLAIVFAIHFALGLAKEGDRFESAGKAIGLTVLALAIVIAGMFLMVPAITNQNTMMWIASALVIAGGLFVMRLAWPAYWKVMMAYSLAARIPVIIVMFLAIKGDWGTHYDAPGPEMSFAEWQAEFINTGLLPQLFLWVPYTVILCGLFGIIAAAIVRRRPAEARA